jgi:hypothetical protein
LVARFAPLGLLQQHLDAKTVKPGAMLSTDWPFVFTNLSAPSSSFSMRMPPS